mmetsp:Transcript_111902/g.280325  ORF Transcript_111902/g.280325 Transcript_111902/m.280325 type:complete len:266 (-) Transcript_111902:174-971(-)
MMRTGSAEARKASSSRRRSESSSRYFSSCSALSRRSQGSAPKASAWRRAATGAEGGPKAETVKMAPTHMRASPGCSPRLPSPGTSTYTGGFLTGALGSDSSPEAASSSVVFHKLFLSWRCWYGRGLVSGAAACTASRPSVPEGGPGSGTCRASSTASSSLLPDRMTKQWACSLDSLRRTPRSGSAESGTTTPWDPADSMSAKTSSVAFQRGTCCNSCSPFCVHQRNAFFAVRKTKISTFSVGAKRGCKQSSIGPSFGHRGAWNVL